MNETEELELILVNESEIYFGVKAQIQEMSGRSRRDKKTEVAKYIKRACEPGVNRVLSNEAVSLRLIGMANYTQIAETFMIKFDYLQ